MYTPLLELFSDYQEYELYDALTSAIDSLFFSSISGHCSINENTLHRLTRIRDAFLIIAKTKTESGNSE